MLDFTAQAHNGTQFTFSKLGKPLVLFFYPKDNTPGCTIENRDFAVLYAEFVKLGFEVIGVSKDSTKSHCNFANKYSLPFMLLVDEDATICNLFKVISDKSMYGKIFKGIERSTFVLDKNGKILKEWRKISATAHAQQVLDYLKTIS
jgi:peroxiredoxin Q/BCP